MYDEIPSARRLMPSAEQNAEHVDRGLPFAAKVAVVAVPIVVGGVVLAITVKSYVGAAANGGLNDTRSPLSEEINPGEISPEEVNPEEVNPEEISQSAPATAAKTGKAKTSNTVLKISPVTGTDAPIQADTPFETDEAYPDIDPDKAPLAVAMNPAIAGISSSGEQHTLSSINSSASTSPKALHGHLPYSEIDPTRLNSAGSFIRGDYERPELLDIEAAQAFELMRQAAQADGVSLMPVSGYRPIAAQQELFKSQTNLKGSAEAAAQSSAPPGHSEHHTGYAIDITDANQPDTDIKQSFEDTAAYQWLAKNAHMYGFEESFPKNNLQGVTFEPWHWRYIGSKRAQQIFSDARRLYPNVKSTEKAEQ